MLLLSDGQDDAARESLPAVAGAATSCLGFGSDHDAVLLSRLAQKGGGSFTYVASTQMLDETLGAFVGAWRRRCLILHPDYTVG